MFIELSKDTIYQYFQNGKFEELLNHFCQVKENDILINYYYFKYLGTLKTYNIFTNLVIKHIDDILKNYEQFNIHVSINKLSVMEIHKHLSYIRNVADLLKNKYQNKMKKCCIYNSSNLFSQIYEIIVPLIDIDTQQKIELVCKSKK
jgi:glycyl-tRNA synthetase alpha subunit